MRHILSGLTFIERISTWIAAALLLAVMIIVSADVFMRYVFNSPFSWAYDLISLYLMAGIFFLVLSPAYAEGTHINVDVIQQSLPPRGIRTAEVVNTAAGLIIFILIAYLGLTRAIDSFHAGDVIAGAIPWPTWPSLALVPFGAGLLSLRLALHLISHVAGFSTGEDIVPPPSHHQPGSEESFE